MNQSILQQFVSSGQRWTSQFRAIIVERRRSNHRTASLLWLPTKQPKARESRETQRLSRESVPRLIQKIASICYPVIQMQTRLLLLVKRSNHRSHDVHHRENWRLSRTRPTAEARHTCLVLLRHRFNELTLMRIVMLYKRWQSTCQGSGLTRISTPPLHK